MKRRVSTQVQAKFLMAYRQNVLKPKLRSMIRDRKYAQSIPGLYSEEKYREVLSSALMFKKHVEPLLEAVINDKDEVIIRGYN